ncbi:hypothetical protein ACROYT_G024850 [Oculina patagonica]
MKGLIFVALVGCVFAIGLALPFTEDEANAYEAELKQIGNDISQSNPKLDDSDEDFDEEELDGPEEDENDDDEDADDDEEDEGESSLSNPLKKSSDPAIPILPFIRVRRVFRGARRIVRRFRRGRSRRGRFFRRG